MPAKRIDLRTFKGNNPEDSDIPQFKEMTAKYKKFGSSLYWIIGIIVMLGAYHCYGSYQEQLQNQSLEKEEAMNCMYQFKTQDCNPLNLTDKCK